MVAETLAFVEIENASQEDYLREKLPGKTLLFFKQTAQECKAALKPASALSVFIKSKVDRAVMEAMPGLKLITTRSTGFDHIDLEAAREKKITVSNVPVYGENTVAEHTF